MRHGGQILVDQLSIQGVKRVFCVPGESFLAALDGLYGAAIETIVGRQEGGVAMMAEAYGKLTGRPGVAFVTRGPGAANASAGVHVAAQDSTPMILFIGQVGRQERNREAFQEVDYGQMFGGMAKWAAEINETARIPEYVSRAFHVAVSGRPGPVVLALPEDMLSKRAEAVDALPANPASNALDEETLQKLAGMLAQSCNPLILAGGGVWSAEAASDLACFAEKFALPVAATFRRQDYFDNDHSHYVGDVGIGVNPELAKRVESSDCLLVIGARLGEMTTGRYKLVKCPNPKQKLIHIYPCADEIGRIYRPDLGIVAAPPAFVKALAKLPAPARKNASREVAKARRAYEAWQSPQETPGALKLEQVAAHMREVLPPTAIVTNGAGNFSAWLHRYYRYRVYGSQLAPTSGTMGYGLPAAVSAKLEYPERPVICFAGDGDFQMHMQEFGTAVQYGANIVVLIANNGLYGTIRMHQERHYPGRVSGTEISNPHFAELAKSYGAYGETVTCDADFPAAFARALKAGKPAILDLKMAPEALSPTLRLAQENPS